MKLTILLVTAVCFWSGLFYFASCSDHPEQRAVEIAERALKATVDNPESIQIKGISKADSVFGKEYVNPHEKAALSMHLMQYGHKLMEETDYFQNLDKDDAAMSANQTLAVFTLWAITVFLTVSKKPYIITLIPALFMTCVCSTYICIAPEGLGLSHTVSYGIGIVCVVVAAVWFYIWMNKQKTRKLSE